MGTSKTKALAKPLEEQETSQLMILANKGDKAACDLFFARMEAEGRSQSIIEALTSGANRLIEIRYEPGIVKEAFRRKLKQMRQELGANTAPPLEKLLIERIVLCWFHLHEVEIRYASQMKESMSLEKATYLQKTLDRAEARYQAAIKALTQVRRLPLPSVQVNIGEKQINISQPGTGQANVQLTEENAEGAPFPNNK